MESPVSPVPLSSPPHTPPPSPSPLRNHPKDDQCFSCKRPGHWAKDCPNKTPKKSAPSSPSGNSPVSASGLPPVRCPCGRGCCRLKTSQTEKNPGRDFYTCTVNCGFFKWCNEISSVIAGAPLCPCGVGICSVNGVYTRPNEDKWYYACRIKKNHGACKFFQWANGESNTLVRDDEGETEGHSSLQSRFIAANGDLREKERSSDVKVLNGESSEHTLENVALSNKETLSDVNVKLLNGESFENTRENVDLHEKETISDVNVKSPNGQSSENTVDLPTITIHDREEIPNKDLVMQESESNDSMTQKGTLVFQPRTQCLNEYRKLISVPGNVVTQVFWRSVAVIYQILGLHAYGWLGRLALPPSKCPEDPPTMPIFHYDSNMSENNGQLLLSLGATNAETDLPPSDILRQDAPTSGGISPGKLVLEDSAVMQDNNISSKLILKTFGRALFDIVESMNPVDPEQMLKVVKHTLIAFQNLSIECGAFMEIVMQYIHNASILASKEQSIQNIDTREILKRYEHEKVKLENVSRLHVEAENEYRASNVSLKSLQDQLAACEAKTTLLKARVDQVYDEVSKSKVNIEVTSRKMEESLELEKQRNAARDAARLALQTARTWLEEY